MLFQRRRFNCWSAGFLFGFGVEMLTGCASPGAPHPPSLQLPEVVSGAVAVRTENQVEIRFQVPSRTTDGQGLRGHTLQGSLCRQETPNAPCKAVDTGQTVLPLPLNLNATPSDTVIWTDVLPSTLSEGPARPVAYRIELKNEAGKSAGPSPPVYAAAGAAPSAVTDLRAAGNRQGALLQWTGVPDSGEVLLQRTQTSPELKPAVAPDLATHPVRPARGTHPIAEERKTRFKETPDPGTTWLTVPPQGVGGGATLDATITEGVTYTYLAVRRITAKIGGRTLELRSAASVPVTFTWHDVYPPAAPEQLTGLGYFADQANPGQASSAGNASSYAVDLVWQPVDDPRVTGYLVSRQALAASGSEDGAAQQLTSEPVSTPAFHDSTATPGRMYRYTVRSTDARGNASQAATIVVQPSPR